MLIRFLEDQDARKYWLNDSQLVFLTMSLQKGNGDVKALLQKVLNAEVSSDVAEPQSIDHGLLIFLGVAETDTEQIAQCMIHKIIHLRIFDGGGSKFDRSLLDIDGEALVISQFTLFADTSRGRRPSFRKAARPEKAEAIFRYFCDQLEAAGPQAVRRGTFGSRMIVKACNFGPFSVPLEIP